MSIQRRLFKKTEALVARLRVTRRGLFSLALEEFVRRQQNKDLLHRLNAAYDDFPDASERALQDRLVRLQRGLLRGKA